MSDTGRPPTAQFIVREVPPSYEIIEIVPDMYGSLSVEQVAVGSKNQMESLFEKLYGYKFRPPPPIWEEKPASNRSPQIICTYGRAFPFF